MPVDKQRRKKLRAQYKASQVAEARRKLRLYPDQLRELRAWLGEQVVGLGMRCDHTLSRTREWAAGTGLDPESVCDAVVARGGCCDCEVLLNVTPDQFGWAEEEPPGDPGER